VSAYAGCSFSIGPRGSCKVGDFTLLNGAIIMAEERIEIGNYCLAQLVGAQTSTPYGYGALVVPATANGHYYMAINDGGTSGGSAPTWPTSGGTVTDGGVIWQDMGTYWTATTKVAKGTLIVTKLKPGSGELVGAR